MNSIIIIKIKTMKKKFFVRIVLTLKVIKLEKIISFLKHKYQILLYFNKK
jgi:hypothetical protein